MRNRRALLKLIRWQ